MLENVYIKTGGTSKCFGSNSGSHGSGETIALEQGEGLVVLVVGVCVWGRLYDILLNTHTAAFKGMACP